MKPISADSVLRLVLSLCLSVLCAAAVIGALPLHGEEQLYDRVIRLHVIAASDTAEDQALAELYAQWETLSGVLEA